MRLRNRLTITVLALAAEPATVLASDSVSLTFRFRVPISCSADTFVTETTDRSASLLIAEYCNASRGYELFLQHDESVTQIFYDGVELVPDESGSTRLASPPRARIHRSKLKLISEEGGNVTLVISPNA